MAPQRQPPERVVGGGEEGGGVVGIVGEVNLIELGLR